MIRSMGVWQPAEVLATAPRPVLSVIEGGLSGGSGAAASADASMSAYSLARLGVLTELPLVLLGSVAAWTVDGIASADVANTPYYPDDQAAYDSADREKSDAGSTGADDPILDMEAIHNSYMSRVGMMMSAVVAMAGDYDDDAARQLWQLMEAQRYQSNIISQLIEQCQINPTFGRIPMYLWDSSIRYVVAEMNAGRYSLLSPLNVRGFPCPQGFQLDPSAFHSNEQCRRYVTDIMRFALYFRSGQIPHSDFDAYVVSDMIPGGPIRAPFLHSAEEFVAQFQQFQQWLIDNRICTPWDAPVYH